MHRIPGKHPITRFRPAPLATAIGLALASTLVQAGPVAIGDVSPLPIGPGDTTLPPPGLSVGRTGVGTVTVDGGELRLLRDAATGAQVRLRAGTQPGGQGTVDIRGGGRVLVDGSNEGPVSGGALPGVFLGDVRGASGTVRVTGPGSALEVRGNTGVMQLGGPGAGADGGRGALEILAGGRVGGDANGLVIMNVGRAGAAAHGSVTVDGAGSLLKLSGVGAPGSGAANEGRAATMLIGRDGARGDLAVSGGGRVTLDDGGRAAAPGFGPSLVVGSGAGGRGTLAVTGAGSEVALSGASWNPYVGIGRTGSGTVSVTDGATLRMTGTGAGTTLLQVGGSATFPGGTGTLEISGTGSRLIQEGGPNRQVQVGAFGATGTLSVTTGGRLESTSLQIGTNGGTGSVRIDGGTVALAGGFADGSGGGVSIGRGAGSTGTLVMANGGRLEIDARGDAGVGLAIGGSRGLAGPGTGTVTMTGGSVIALSNLPANGGVSVGREGTGSLTMTGGSRLEAAGGRVTVGQLPGAVGTLSVGAGSSVTTGMLAIGYTGTGTAGTGTVVLDGGRVEAGTIRLGATGMLAGNGTVAGTVINGGTIGPGFSPGRLVIDGFYVDDGGRLVLEVDDDGRGGFVTDQLVFRAGRALDFANADVEFVFLSGADPLRFLASGGFGLDTFFRVLGDDGTERGLSSILEGGRTLDDLFAGAAFSALGTDAPVTDFVFDAADGVLNLVVPGAVPGEVPLPGTLVLLAGGALALVARGRRR